MATHPRQLIRRAVVEQLQGKTAAAARVFPSRMVPWKHLELPGIAVLTPEEDSELANMKGGLKRDLTVKIVGGVTVDENLDDALDSLAQEIEDAVKLDETFAKTALQSRLAHTETRLADEQGRPVGVIELEYAVEYRT